MILLVDVAYDDAADRALAAGVVLTEWTAERALATFTREIRGLASYATGEFFRRELPCLRPVIDAVREAHVVAAVVVDGFVDLGARGPGLGRKLHEAYGGNFEVIGVAKTPFAGRPGLAVLRGTSARPLWVTSTADERAAAEHVRRMAGPHRIPTMLGLVDALSRAGAPPHR